MNTPPSLRPCTAGLYISSACAGGRTKTPGVVARATYDAILCMYHDQALIPVKTLDFHGGINVTLGLPFIRTSPDHGTAFGLAGKGTARPDSLIAAITLAADMASRA